MQTELTLTALIVLNALEAAGFEVPEWDYPSNHTIRIKADKNDFDANIWLRIPGAANVEETEAVKNGGIYCSEIAVRDRRLVGCSRPLETIGGDLTIAEASLVVVDAYKAALKVRREAKQQARDEALVA
jgi:hypothetical protein